MANGEFRTYTGTTANLVLKWSSTPNASNNTSNLIINLYLEHSRISIGARSGNPYFIDGDYFSYDVLPINKTVSGLTQTLLLTRSITAYHNSNGTKVLNLDFNYNLKATIDGKYLGVLNVNQNISLDTIVTPPAVVNNVLVTPLSSTTGKLTYNTDSTIEYIKYSFDEGVTWNNVPYNNVIQNLKPNTRYNGVFSFKKSSNGLWTTVYGIGFVTPPDYVESITLNDITMYDTDIKQVIPSISPSFASNKTFQIVIDDTNVAQVNGNYVVGKSKGETNIYVRALDGSNVISNIAKLKVLKKVTGIYTATQNITLSLDNNVTQANISYTIQPSNASNLNVTFSSSDEKIATVDLYGKVTAKAIGKCTITLRTAEGGYTATVNVNVSGTLPWIDMTNLPTYVNFYDLNNIYTNQKYICNKLIDNGYLLSLTDLREINLTGNEDYDTIIYIYDNIEYNMSIINSNDCESIYFDMRSVSIGSFDINTRETIFYSNEPTLEQYQRWINILNDMKTIVDGTFKKWAIIKPNNGLYDFAIERNSDKILCCRYEYIGINNIQDGDKMAFIEIDADAYQIANVANAFRYDGDGTLYLANNGTYKNVEVKQNLTFYDFNIAELVSIGLTTGEIQDLNSTKSIFDIKIGTCDKINKTVTLDYRLSLPPMCLKKETESSTTFIPAFIDYDYIDNLSGLKNSTGTSCNEFYFSNTYGINFKAKFRCNLTNTDVYFRLFFDEVVMGGLTRFETDFCNKIYPNIEIVLAETVNGIIGE